MSQPAKSLNCEKTKKLAYNIENACYKWRADYYCTWQIDLQFHKIKLTLWIVNVIHISALPKDKGGKQFFWVCSDELNSRDAWEVPQLTRKSQFCLPSLLPDLEGPDPRLMKPETGPVRWVVGAAASSQLNELGIGISAGGGEGG